MTPSCLFSFTAVNIEIKKKVLMSSAIQYMLMKKGGGAREVLFSC
jgi:hypothetical protein